MCDDAPQMGLVSRAEPRWVRRMICGRLGRNTRFPAEVVLPPVWTTSAEGPAPDGPIAHFKNRGRTHMPPRRWLDPLPKQHFKSHRGDAHAPRRLLYQSPTLHFKSHRADTHALRRWLTHIQNYNSKVGGHTCPQRMALAISHPTFQKSQG